MFHHSRVLLKIIPLETLKEITNNFSKEQELGSGTFGTVYKGVKDGEEIAVKYLRTQGYNDHEKFKAEFENLWGLRHPNIVQLLGYCYETKHELVQCEDGRHVWADNIYRALCFEYMHNGSLGNHLFDEHNGHEWQTRYKIIKGTCDGLKYLHEGLNTPMHHLDLKPDNLLLDKNMVPKLADFGLSRFIDDDQTQATQNCIGTRGFLPPEYISYNLVSNKFDIFSLGVVMIMLISGKEGYFKKADMSSQQFINLVKNFLAARDPQVYEKWRNRIQKTSGCTAQEAKCQQVRTCIQIALECVDTDRAKRPTIGDIVRRLNELESRISAAPARPQQRSVGEGPKDSDTDGVIIFKPGGVCFEIGTEGMFASAHGEAACSRHGSQMLDFNPKPANSEGKGKLVIPHTVGTLSSKEFSHGLTKTDLCTSTAMHMPSPGFGKQLDEPALELSFALDVNKGIQCHGILTDRSEEVNKIDGGVSRINKDKEQENLMVSGLVDSDNIIKKPYKDANNQMEKLITRGGKSQPKDAGTKDRKNGVCSKDAKTVLPQPTVRQAQQTQMKELMAPRQPMISPKRPFAVAVPVKDIDDSIVDIPDEASGEERSVFDGFYDPKMPSPGFGKHLNELAPELQFPLEFNKGIRCEEVNKIDGVSPISVDGLMDSHTIVKKPNKDADSLLKKLDHTRGAKGQPKDAGAKDRKNGVCSKDAKMVLPQPTVQQPQQVQMKGVKAPQQHNLISRKEPPFAVAAPVKGPKSVEFDAPSKDIDDSMFYGLFDIDEEGFKTEPTMITKPLAMPLGANGGDNTGANGGGEIQAQVKGNGNSAVKRVSSRKQNGGSSGGGRQMQNVDDVALGLSMTGLAGSAGTCQTGGGSVDRPHTGSMQLGSGGVGAAIGMPVRGMPALGFYQQGGAAASTSIPTGQAMPQDAVAARNTMAARQQHMAPAQQLKVSGSKKMQ